MPDYVVELSYRVMVDIEAADEDEAIGIAQNMSIADCIHHAPDADETYPDSFVAPIEQDGDTEEKICHQCDGSGHVEDDAGGVEDCPMCYGNGHL